MCIRDSDGYLYVVLHGIDFRAGEKGFATHDVDFFIGPNYLVTVHDGNSRSIDEIQHGTPRVDAGHRRPRVEGSRRLRSPGAARGRVGDVSGARYRDPRRASD